MSMSRGSRPGRWRRSLRPCGARLAELIGKVAASKTKVSTKCLEVSVDEADQHKFGQVVLEHMGFDSSSAGGWT